MQPRIIINSALVIALVLVAGLAWQQNRACRATRAELATLERQRAPMAANAMRAARELAAAEGERTMYRAKLDDLSESSVTALNVAPKPAARSALKRPWIPERLRNEPAFQVLWLADRQASLTTRYGPLFQKLGLTPAQLGKVQTAMLARDEREMDLQATEPTGELSKNDPVMLGTRLIVRRENS